MKTLKKIADKTIYIIPTVFYTIPFLLKLVYYPISDDYLLTFVARGAYDNKPNSHLLVINETLTSIWEKLYGIFPHIEWYVVTIVLLVLFNSYVVFFILKRRFNKYVSLIIVLAIEMFMLVWISFTVIAYYTAFTLGAFIFYCLKNEIKWYKEIIIIGILVFGGYCFRDKAFISGFVAVCPIIFFSIKKENLKRIILSGAVVGLLILILMGVNRYVYSQGELSNTLEWAVARAKVGDYPISEYKDNKALYDSIGYSENDYLGLKWEGYYMADLNTYSTKNLKTIVEETPFDIRYNTNIKAIVIGMAKIKEMWAFLIVIAIMIWLRKTKKQIMFSISEIVLVLGQCIYLFFIGRPGDRILIPLLFFSMLAVMLFSLFAEDKNDKKSVRIVCLIIPIALVALYSKQLFEVRNYQIDRQSKYGEIEKYINSHSNTLYTINYHHLILMNKPVELYREPKLYNNILELSNYEVLFSDIYYNKVKEYNLKDKDNLLIDIAENNNVLFIDLDNKHIHRIETYIKEHTGKNVEKKVIKSFKKSKTKIYKIKYR